MVFKASMLALLLSPFILISSMDLTIPLDGSNVITKKEALIEYPQSVYPWYETIKGLSRDVQGLLLQAHGCPSLETYASITRPTKPVYVHECALSNDSCHLAYSTMSKCVILNIETLELTRIGKVYRRFCGLAFNQDGTRLALIDTDGILYVVELNDYKPVDQDMPEEGDLGFLEGYQIFDQGIAGQNHILLDFLPDHTIIMVHSHGEIYRFNEHDKKAYCLLPSPCTNLNHVPYHNTCEKNIYFAFRKGTSAELILVTHTSDVDGQRTVELFNADTRERTAPLVHKFVPRSWNAADCNNEATRLIDATTVWNLDSTESREIFTQEKAYAVKISPDSRFVLHVNFSEKESTLFHLSSGSKVTSRNFEPKLYDPKICFGSKYIALCDGHGIRIHKVKLLWKFHADLLERRCDFEQYMFVKFLDDCAQQGLELKQSGLIVTPNADLKVVSEQVLGEHPHKFELLLKKPSAWSILRTAGLKILKADVRKAKPVDPNESSPRKLSGESITRLRAIWERFSESDRRDLAVEYGVDL